MVSTQTAASQRSAYARVVRSTGHTPEHIYTTVQNAPNLRRAAQTLGVNYNTFRKVWPGLRRAITQTADSAPLQTADRVIANNPAQTVRTWLGRERTRLLGTRFPGGNPPSPPSPPTPPAPPGGGFPGGTPPAPTLHWSTITRNCPPFYTTEKVLGNRSGRAYLGEYIDTGNALPEILIRDINNGTLDFYQWQTLARRWAGDLTPRRPDFTRCNTGGIAFQVMLDNGKVFHLRWAANIDPLVDFLYTVWDANERMLYKMEPTLVVYIRPIIPVVSRYLRREIGRRQGIYLRYK